MSSSVTVVELMATFRMGLLALIPVAERRGIAWNGARVYDPWENMECVLFESLVGSIAENATDAPFRPMPRYGVSYPSYADFSFITDRSAWSHEQGQVFLELATTDEPFDTARFVAVDSNFLATDKTLDVSVSKVRFEFAARAGQRVTYRDVIEYDD